MPSNLVKTKKDEKYWNRAKEKAEEAGHKDNWAYVVSIYKRMRGSSLNRFQKIAYNMLMG